METQCINQQIQLFRRLTEMAVLLIGAGDSSEQTLLANSIKSHGDSIINCDTHDWPSNLPITFSPSENDAVLGDEFNISDLSGVYIQYYQTFQPDEPRFNNQISENPVSTLNQLREYRSIFQSVAHVAGKRGAKVISPIQNHGLQDRKPSQMETYESSNISVPDTVFTNDPKKVRSFFESHENAIYKPVTRGGLPHRLTDQDLTESRLEKLATAPIQLQEYAPGTDIRIYVLDGAVISSVKYESSEFSFKLDLYNGEEIEVKPTSISDEIAKAVIKASKDAGFVFAAADVRRQEDNSYALLELNETPRFAAVHEYTDQNVAEKLSGFLTE